MNDMQEYGNKTMEYVLYIIEHKNNYLKAWQELQEKCKDEDFVSDEVWKAMIDDFVFSHDNSKFSQEEFVPYRRKFYPCDFETENVVEFEWAWEHHYRNNDHHWEYWINDDGTFKDGSIAHKIMSAILMVLDWQAMGYKFGNNALDYYNQNKDKMVFQAHMRSFIERILEKLCGEERG